MPRRTHASQNPPAEQVGTDSIDVVAGEPPVPLTVWRTPSGTAPTAGPPPLRGSTSLLAACWPLHPTRGRHKARLRWLLHAGVALLRPGGCLVLVVRGKPGTAVPAAPQDYSPLVDAAADAGLGYLQHIVAVHADIDGGSGDRFTYYATDADLAALTSGERAVAHLPVHADLMVFTPPRTPPAPGASAGAGRGG